MYKIIPLSLLFLCSPFAVASVVNINVYGSVIASPCELETKNYLIDLNKINIRNIKNNQKSDWVDFSIRLKNCPITTNKVTMTLKGTVDPNYPEYFINSGTAKNTALNIATQLNKNIIKNNEKLIVNINQQTHNAEFPLSARIIGYGSNITVGSFKSHLELTLLYN
ncbi:MULTISPECIES: fimbrial protein [Proteus]|uniref:fimbrial protein n=1 Tax=Proteus TaxID=583 RepID=UPI000D69E286|nr:MULTISPECIES: fimbrial protein [Proteus]MBG5950021.1 type 1 fimbrial protein [Proteus terrae]MCE9840707.1 type 1 fimbrial protein [Proteus terrae]NBN69577.1 fimbrial protein [Proteus sp. G2618]QIG05057.1 fimbrial protein [Proteus sp. ZN5]